MQLACGHCINGFLVGVDLYVAGAGHLRPMSFVGHKLLNLAIADGNTCLCSGHSCDY